VANDIFCAVCAEKLYVERFIGEKFVLWRFIGHKFELWRDRLLEWLRERSSLK
jgi:hypothetical protein